eukprot:3103631-Alexandrium_andersonii.AAC.1
MSASLVGSEMCIRDRVCTHAAPHAFRRSTRPLPSRVSVHCSRNGCPSALVASASFPSARA